MYRWLYIYIYIYMHIYLYTCLLPQNCLCWQHRSFWCGTRQGPLWSNSSCPMEGRDHILKNGATEFGAAWIRRRDSALHVLKRSAELISALHYGVAGNSALHVKFGAAWCNQHLKFGAACRNSALHVHIRRRAQNHDAEFRRRGPSGCMSKVGVLCSQWTRSIPKMGNRRQATGKM